MKLDLINMSKVPTAESVGESDKVLIESGGEIKKTAASNIGGGGGGENNIFYIDIANIDGTNHTFTVSTSVEEMTEAFESNKHCFLRYGFSYFPVNGYETGKNYVGFSASEVSVYDGSIAYRSFEYEYEDGEVTSAVYNAAEKTW